MPGAAKERWMVLLEEFVEVLTRNETSRLPGKPAKRRMPRLERERGSDRRVGS
jgi:hypothetical protein